MNGNASHSILLVGDFVHQLGECIIGVHGAGTEPWCFEEEGLGQVV